MILFITEKKNIAASHDSTVDLLQKLFDIEEFRQEQIDLIRKFCNRRNIFFSAPTGYGKSIVYQSIPWYYDEMNGQYIG